MGPSVSSQELTGAARIREILASDDPLVTPGIFDPLSAMLVEQAGFDAALISSFALTASMGICDVGLITGAETVEAAGRMVRAVHIPIICDADTGYGNYVNVMRTIRELERVGIAGAIIEDGLTPHNRIGRPIISKEEMVGKIEAAVEARENPDFFIGVRTDAAPTIGLEDAIERGKAYVAAGADAFLALDVREIEDMKRVIDAVEGHAIAVISLPHPPVLSVPELTELGFKIIVPSVPTLFAAVKAMSETLAALKSTGSLETVRDSLCETAFITELLGLPQLRDLERKYLGTEDGFTPW
jgi:2,3-dimethylmalate lyase